MILIITCDNQEDNYQKYVRQIQKFEVTRERQHLENQALSSLSDNEPPLIDEEDDEIEELYNVTRNPTPELTEN